MKAARATLGVVVALTIGVNTATLARSSAQSGSSPEAVASVAGSGASVDDIDRLIGDLETQMARTPTSSGLNLLARLYLSRGRVTGDVSSFVRAQTVVDQSLSTAARNPEARTLDAEIRYTNHEFSAARRLAAAIVTDAPDALDALTVRADAERELGDYAAANESVRTLRVKAGANPAVMVRDARLRFLTGDPEAAAQRAEDAERRATTSGLLGPALSFYPAFRGQLALDAGDYSKAAEHFIRALTITPGDRVATVGLARSLAATGKVSRAETLLADLTDRYPDPVALAVLGDLRTKLGDSAGAKDAYALVEAIADLAGANGRVYDRELALFYANHDVHLDAALRLARGEADERHDVYAYDTLAWVELKNGNTVRAEQAIRRALAIGTPDARIHFHAGMVFASTGAVSQAEQHLRTALEISPHFDILLADVARSELRRLGGRS